jgi:hypothetical protein
VPSRPCWTSPCALAAASARRTLKLPGRHPELGRPPLCVGVELSTALSAPLHAPQKRTWLEHGRNVKRLASRVEQFADDDNPDEPTAL